MPGDESDKTQSILVTGGAGFIGRHLVRKLAVTYPGHKVIALDDFSAYGVCTPLDIDVTFGKVQNLQQSDFPDCKFDLIFHLAAVSRIQPSFADPVGTHEVNCTGTIRTLEFARRDQARVIFAGTSCYYQDHHASPYAYTKWIGEEHCKLYRELYGVDALVARFFNVYGPECPAEGSQATVVGIFEKQVTAGSSLTVTGDGSKRRDFIHVDDVVSGMIALSKNWDCCHPFNLGTGINHSILEVARMFGNQIEFLPERPGEDASTLADIANTYVSTGWQPVIRLEDYVRDFLKSLT